MYSKKEQNGVHVQRDRLNKVELLKWNAEI